MSSRVRICRFVLVTIACAFSCKLERECQDRLGKKLLAQSCQDRLGKKLRDVKIDWARSFETWFVFPMSKLSAATTR